MSCRIEITLRKVVNFSQHAKYPLPLNRSTGAFLPLLFTVILLLAFGAARAQGDTTRVKKDSVKTQPEGDIKSSIAYSADDSINTSIDRKIIKLYGNAKVKYGDIELEAEHIVIDYDASTITANGKRDSTGQLVGFPIFRQGQGEYETKGMVYNFKTKKASITEVVTKEGEGFIHGQKIYKNNKNEMFTVGNAYTTCDLAQPHFRIISKKAKAIPGDKTVSGPFYMEFNGVPTPLGFAFGIFPSPRSSASGIIVPAYGEERVRGFFLRGGGYYFDINDYIKLTLTGDIYSKGSTALYLRTNYISRYKYTGSVNFSFTNNITGANIENPTIAKDFSLVWSHAPKTKGTSRFSASVNAATGTYISNNFVGLNPATTTGGATRPFDQNTQKMSSNISFSKTFPGTPLSLGINMRHNQDLKTGKLDMSLPDISFNVNNIYPFKKSQSMVLQNLSVKYTLNATNQITNDLGNIAVNSDGSTRDSIASFNGQNIPLFLKNAKKGIRTNIPLSTSFKIMKYFTVTTGATVDQLFYFDKLNWTAYGRNALNLGSRAVVKDTVHQFNMITNFGLNVGMTTRIYGMYLAKNKNARIRAIRHLVSPTIGFNYTPNFGDPRYGYYQSVGLTDAKGKPYTVQKSIHDGFIYGSSKTGASESLSFGIGNTLEMKVRGAKDTVDKKISILNNLSISSGYNFLADSFKLAPISMSANSNILNNKININANASLDPYQYWQVVSSIDEKTGIVYREQRVSRYAWNAGKLGRVTSASLNFSTNLNPKGQKKDADTRSKIGNSNASQADKNYLLQHPDTYVDFNIPWNLRLSYNINYSHTSAVPAVTQSLTMSGDVSLSQKWKVTFNGGFDFQQNQFTTTNFAINRDLHCWQVSLSWVPFGPFQSYMFNIGIKSSLLKDLKLNRTRSFFDTL